MEETTSTGPSLLDRVMAVAGKLSQNKAVLAIQYGAMGTMPLTLGTALIAILYNLPIPALQELWTSTGIGVHMNEVISVTMSMTAIYMSTLIGYNSAQLRGKSGVTGAVLSLGAFLALMPHLIPVELTDAEGNAVTSVAGLPTGYLGSDGIFAGMVLALVIVGIYVWLDNKGLVITLPDGVPPMVAQSLAPSISAIIIFTIVLVIRVAFGFTAWGNYFDFINGVIGAPIMALGSSPASALLVMVLAAACWFFGIHPNTILMMYYPVLMTAGAANSAAFLAGEPLPFLLLTATFSYYAFGGTGNTLGLALIMPFTAKSERYKALGKLAIGPGLFNINEPLIFGLPIMLNPIYFIPLVGTAFVNGLMGILFYHLGVFNTLNPTVSLPWVTPAFVTPFFTIGIIGVLAAIAVIVIDGLIYFPFYRRADQLAYEEEQAAATAATAETSA